MENEDIIIDDQVTLTRAQWEDLMRSIQSLSLANAKLVETIAYLLKQCAAADPDVFEMSSTQENGTNFEFRGPADKETDPYDLTELRRLVEGSE